MTDTLIVIARCARLQFATYEITTLTTTTKTSGILHLIMLKAVKQYVQVKGGHIVANQHIWVQAVEPVHEVA